MTLHLILENFIFGESKTRIGTLGAGEMMQWLNKLATKPDNLNPIRGTYRVGKKTKNNSHKLSSACLMDAMAPKHTGSIHNKEGGGRERGKERGKEERLFRNQAGTDMW